MRRGDICLVDFEPVIGSEANEVRPAVVSNDTSNDVATSFGIGTITVVAVTSNVSNVQPFQMFLPAAKSGLDRDSNAQAEQVRSVSPRRIRRTIGIVPDELLSDLDDALRLHLRL